jgi:hypothetical protein
MVNGTETTHIQVILDGIDRTLGKTFTRVSKRIAESGRQMARQQTRVNKLMSGGAQKLINNATQINKLGKRHERFFKVMGMSVENLKKFNQGGGVFDKRSARFANRLRLMTHGLRGFRMEMLGVQHCKYFSCQ